MIVPKKLKSKIAAWNMLAEQLRELRAAESALRDEIVSELCPDPKEGTHKFDISSKGHVIKVSQNYTRKVDADKIKQVATKLPRGIGKQLFKNKPSLVKKVYDELPQKYRKIVDDCLTIAPAKPTMQIVEPKD